MDNKIYTTDNMFSENQIGICSSFLTEKEFTAYFDSKKIEKGLKRKVLKRKMFTL